MKILNNIQFEDIPREFIDQLNSCDFSYNDYLNCCPLMNQIPLYWNFMVVTDDDDVAAFVWGMIDPLDKFMHVIRISILPEYRKENGEVLAFVGESLRDAAFAMGASHAFFITDRPEIYLTKVPDKVKISQGKLVEVRLYENLH